MWLCYAEKLRILGSLTALLNVVIGVENVSNTQGKSTSTNVVIVYKQNLDIDCSILYLFGCILYDTIYHIVQYGRIQTLVYGRIRVT